MDESLKHINPNPVLTANFISRGLFWWCNPLFKKGYKTPLQESDLYNVCPSDSSEYLGNKLEREWIKQLKRQDKGETPSLLHALVSTFGLQYLLIGFVVLLEEGTKVIQPILLGGLIRYFIPASEVSKMEAWMYALGVSLCAIILAVAHHPYFFCVQRIGMRMRVACCSLMYRKCLRLSNKALGETTTGQIVNLMSNDVNRFDQAVIFLHFLWVGPLQAIAVLVILWIELGPSVVAGFIVLLLLIPMQGFMGKLFSKLRHKTAVHTDERVKVMHEIISGMRVIKMYCWEKPFRELVEKIRSQERHVLWRVKQLTAYTSSVWVIVHRALYYSLAVGVSISQSWPSLRPAPLYTATPLLFLVAYNLVGCVFEAVRSQGECLATCRRVQKFLLLEETDPASHVEHLDLRTTVEESFLQLDSVTAKWEGSSSDMNTLEDITLRIEPGKLVAVIGPVGAGKSSLLMSVLGELPPMAGHVRASGRLAYVSQQPWIFSGSLRQNIVFGSKFDKAKYDRVIRVSALKRDFEIMPQGDATLIGDRGASLSGGQRARVSLARALYMDADIYLLDDPLSAVDAAVGRHIFEKCIVKHLKNKPRILVTHQVQFLPSVDEIYIIKDGRINGHGSFDELSSSGVDFSELLKRPESEDPPSSVSQNLTLPSDVMTPNRGSQEFGSRLSIYSMLEEYEPEPVQLPEEEERVRGTVGYKVYVDYFKAGTGLFKFLLLVVVNVAAQLFYVASDWWLARWSNQEEEKFAAMEKHRLFLMDLNITDLSNTSIISNITVPCVDSHFNIYVFTGIILAVFIFSLARALLFFKIAVDASQQLHNKMFARILGSPVSFFDTNPVGRILNRFSKDVGHMDDLLPVTFFDFIQCALLIIGIVLVAGIVNPYVFIPTLPLAILFIMIRKYYLQTSRSVKRLEGTSRSPVFSYLSATLQGIHTIRSMLMEERFAEEFDAYQDRHTEAWFLFLATSRWLAVRLDWVCALFVTAVTICSVLAADTMNAGLVGLSITYTMTLMGMFQWGVRQSAEVENQMISVERVIEYSHLPQEAELESGPHKKPPPGWPQNGAITGINVSLQYSTKGPFVLKNLNFSIHGQEKVGIVGRTGAGKSSLITTLFRMVEPQGCVLIDDINILEIGLHDLRSNISIIPQDPVLFTGTLKKNLDPFQHYTDDQLWRALEEVKLKDPIRSIPEGLCVEVSEGGVNFSVGQRQLICLARAILGNNRILLIDEATANVDPITDELIQQTIRTKFRDCTVLTIAHRLNTIMDSDRVMVLDNGVIVEFDHPHVLLSTGQGYFYDMAQQMGRAEFERLFEVAQGTALKSGKQLAPTNRFNFKNSLKTNDDKTETVCSVSPNPSDSLAVDLSYDLADIEESLQLDDDDDDNEHRDKLREDVDDLILSETALQHKLVGTADKPDKGFDDGDDENSDKLHDDVENLILSEAALQHKPAGIADKPDKRLDNEARQDGGLHTTSQYHPSDDSETIYSPSDDHLASLIPKSESSSSHTAASISLNHSNKDTHLHDDSFDEDENDDLINDFHTPLISSTCRGSMGNLIKNKKDNNDVDSIHV